MASPAALRPVPVSGGDAMIGASFMSERDNSYDEAVRRGAAEESDPEPSTRRLGRRPAHWGDEPTGSGSRRNLRGFITRLFENTMPYTAGEEAAKFRRDADGPGWARRAGTIWNHPVDDALPATPGYAGGAGVALAGVDGGALSWADTRFGVTARKTSTPRGIVRLFGLIVLLTLLAFVTCSVAISQMRDTIRTIGVHAKPAIDATERMRTALGAMDVDAASDSLLGDAVSTGTSREFAADVSGQIAAMVQASAGVRFGDPEAAGRLQAMQYDLHLYYAALGEGRDAGRSKPWIAAQRVKFASRLLRSHVMVEADAFEASNRAQLEEAYTQTLDESLILGGSFLGIGVLLAASLVGAQIFLLRRTRRLINIPLALATALLVVAIGGVGISILQERADLQAGKTDALDRLVALRHAKAAGYAVNADQAMWLIDHEANRLDYERDFVDHARLMLAIDQADLAGLARLQARYAAPESAVPLPPLTGLLGSAFTHPGQSAAERAPTARAISAFLDFLQVDARLHDLEDKGDHRGALELRTGNKPGQSLFAFAKMDKELDASIGLADAAFEQRFSSATAIAGWMPVITGSALGLVLALAAAGLWLRYQEYR